MPRASADLLRALALCLAGGIAASLANIPLAWTIGPLLAMAAGKLGGASLRPPQGGRQAGQAIIGAALGLHFTPAVVQEVAAWAPLLLLAALLALLIAWLCAKLLARLTDTDATTAFFASVPGGASEMAVLALRFGARLERVALAHALRIMLVVLVVPAALAWAGMHGDEIYRSAARELSWPGLLLLFAAGAATGYALYRLRLPNCWMFGPLLASGMLTAWQIELSAMPPLLLDAGQLLIGCSLGASFERDFLRRAPRFVAGVGASVMLAMVAAAAFALAIAAAARLSAPTMIVSLAPGGIAEMCITAEVLRLGVPLVTAFHVTRVVLLVACTAPAYELALRLRGQRR